MPTAPLRGCRHTGCPALVENGYCPTHIKDAGLADRWRGSACSRGYDRQWRNVRGQHVRDNPLCVDCLDEKRITAIEHVHHTVKVKVDPSQRLNRDVLMSLCRRHHDIRTA